MDTNAKSGLRELQIGRGLVTLRWAAIPILLGFSMLAIRYLRMSFSIPPIYLLACVLAVMNVGFTIHISMLTRQLAMRRGTAGLHRFINRVLFHQALNGITAGGLRGVLALPGIVYRVVGCLYLLLLEMFKRLRVNPLSAENITHGQVLFDLLALLLFVRFTGATESPLPVLMAVPIVVAGAVLGFHQGLIYGVVAAGGYLALGLLTNLGWLRHIKFYDPGVGDLGQSYGWTWSSFLMLLIGLWGVAYLAHHLTAVFRERIYFLNQLLERNRRHGLVQNTISELINDGYVVVDDAGTVVLQKTDSRGLLPTGIIGRNLYEAIPSFKQGGLTYVVQSVLGTAARKDLDRFRFVAAEGTSHYLNLRIVPLTTPAGQSLAVILITDVTDQLFLQERLEEIRKELDSGQTEFNRASFELKETNDQLMRSLKLANERSIEIDRLTEDLRLLTAELNEQRNRGDSLAAQLARTKAENDALQSDLGYRQLMIDEMSDLLRTCTQLDQLVATIERHTRTVFKLDSSCLHVFSTPADGPGRVREVLEEPKASPKLLDVPRKNPKVLEPLLKEGRPVLIKAAVRPDQASMQIQDGALSRLIAYIPVRDGNEVLGMMMLERFGQDEHHDRMLESLVTYLNHTATAIKNAVAVRQMLTSQAHVRNELATTQKRLQDFLDLLSCNSTEDGYNWRALLQLVGRLSGSSDALMARFRPDGSTELLGRADGTRPEDPDRVETQIIETLKRNPNQMASYHDSDGSQAIRGFPLTLDHRCIGVLLLRDTTVQESTGDTGNLVRLLAALVADRLALAVLREEKELWESFYATNLRA